MAVTRRISYPAATAIVLALLFCVGCLTFWLYHTRRYEDSSIARVSWQEGGQPGYIEWEVVGSDGSPFAFMPLEFWNSSGRRHVLLDKDGRATTFGEGLVEIKLNDVRILHRPFAHTFNYPSASKGLAVRIVVKEPTAFGL